jgi:asparagine synthase (glutamine-hydrolysing)
MKPRRGTKVEATGEESQFAELEDKLQAVRQKLKKSRESNATLRGYHNRALQELDILRAFTLDMFPEVEVPPNVAAVMAAVRAEKLTYLTDLYLNSLVTCVLETERAGREGLLIEAGTALGGSAIAMAAAKDQSRPMRVYDVFGMIPPPSEKDGADVIERYASISEGNSRGLDGEVYYGYREDLLGEVTASFARHGVPVESNNVTLVKGLFQDTLEVDEPVALAHVDGDWYQSTMVCLERIAPHLVEGGRIVIDDYFMWSGCREAVDEYFADRSGYLVEHRAKVHIVRL